MISLNEIKKYIRITHNEDDAYLLALIEMSKDYIEQMTGVAYSSTDKIYEQAILLMTTHFYDVRVAVSEKNLIQVPYSLDSLVKHISMRGSLNE